MDTTSSALTRMLWILANHPTAQSRLRKELDDACDERGAFGYDDLMALPFLDSVYRETLRLWDLPQYR